MVYPTVALMLLAGGALILAAGFDIVRFQIPDVFALVILVSGLAHCLITRSSLPSHAAAPIVTLMAGLLVFRAGIMGGGDIKLLVATAAWTGLAGLMPLLIAISLAGGVVAMILFLARATTANFGKSSTLPVLQAGAPIPYGVAIALGSLAWAGMASPFIDA